MMIYVTLIITVIILTAIGIQKKDTRQWKYLIDNVSINECRLYDNLAEAYEIMNLCLEDGHEVKMLRIKI